MFFHFYSAAMRVIEHTFGADKSFESIVVGYRKSASCMEMSLWKIECPLECRESEKRLAMCRGSLTP